MRSIRQGFQQRQSAQRGRVHHCVSSDAPINVLSALLSALVADLSDVRLCEPHDDEMPVCDAPRAVHSGYAWRDEGRRQRVVETVPTHREVSEARRRWNKHKLDRAEALAEAEAHAREEELAQVGVTVVDDGFVTFVAKFKTHSEWHRPGVRQAVVTKRYKRFGMLTV